MAKTVKFIKLAFVKKVRKIVDSIDKTPSMGEVMNHPDFITGVVKSHQTNKSERAYTTLIVQEILRGVDDETIVSDINKRILAGEDPAETVSIYIDDTVVAELPEEEIVLSTKGTVSVNGDEAESEAKEEAKAEVMDQPEPTQTPEQETKVETPSEKEETAKPVAPEKEPAVSKPVTPEKPKPTLSTQSHAYSVQSTCCDIGKGIVDALAARMAALEA